MPGFFGKKQKSNDIGVILWAHSDGLGGLYQYDIRKSAWFALSNDTVNVRVIQDDYAVIGFNGKFYVAGGNIAAAVTNAVDVYDLATDTWSAGPAMNIARENFSMAVVGDRIYAAGGFDGAVQLSSVEYLEPLNDNVWHTVSNMPNMSRALGGTGLNGLLYIYDNTNAFQYYNPSTDTWTALTSAGALAGNNSKLVTVGQLIYAAGSDAAKISSYDFNTNAWTIRKASVPSILNSQLVFYDHKIYCIAANAGTTVQTYYPTFNYWNTDPVLNFTPVASPNYQIAVVNWNK